MFPSFNHPDLAGVAFLGEVVGMKVAQKRKLHITGKFKLRKVQIENFGANLNALFVQGPVWLRTGWRRRKVMFFRKTVLINVDQWRSSYKTLYSDFGKVKICGGAFGIFNSIDSIILFTIWQHFWKSNRGQGIFWDQKIDFSSVLKLTSKVSYCPLM